MNKSIIEKLRNECRVVPIDPSASAKTKTVFTCQVCGEDFHNTASSIIQRNKNYGSVGCPSCVKTASLLEVREANRINLSLKFELPDNFSSHSYKDIITVTNKKCGHIFSTKLDNLISGGVDCPVCESSRRSKINEWATPPKREDMPLGKLLEKLHASNLKFNRIVNIKDHGSYGGMLVPITFTCDVGHEWNARPANVIHLGSGCPYCAKANYSKVAIRWISSLPDAHNIRHAENGGEVRLRGKSGRLYSVDGYDENTKTVYEFNGSAYHGDPNLYTNDETPHPFKKNYTARELKQLTTSKASDLFDAGYQVISMWESQFKNSNKLLKRFDQSMTQLGFDVSDTNTGSRCSNGKLTVYYHDINLSIESLVGTDFMEHLSTYGSDRVVHFFSDEFDRAPELTIKKIRYLCGDSHTLPKIYARKCNVLEIENSVGRRFIEANHIQGGDNSQLYFGLSYDGNIVAVMAFSKPRIFMGKNSSDNNTWELSRFAVDGGYLVPGASSKLLSAFSRKYNPSVVFSYADKRWSEGDLYYKLGFVRSEKSYKAYFYNVDGKRLHRFGWRKSLQDKRLQVFDKKLSEYQNMLRNGYDRIWDCGSIKFTKTYSK